jgi:ABC-2 type transport system ATP-binding protein
MASLNLWEIQQTCDRIAVLNKGRLVATGTPMEIREAVSDKVNLTLVFESNDRVTTNRILSSLGKISGILRQEVTENVENGYSTLRIQGDTDFDYLELFGLLSTARVKIRSVEATSPSLEDAFIKLTRELKP